jgi:predicted RNA-binding Zn-ribbon protein involved in translation (DUF1610 family)
MAAELQALDAEYRNVARRFRKTHDREAGCRLGEIRKQIKVLVEAEIAEEYEVEERSEAASSSSARRDRRHRSAPWQLDHAERECEGCGATFQPTDSRQLYCTPQCGAQHRRYRNAHGGSGGVHEGGQDGVHEPLDGAVGAVTNGASGTCAHCGAGPLPVKRSTKRYCSPACKQAAYRDRKSAA